MCYACKTIFVIDLLFPRRRRRRRSIFDVNPPPKEIVTATTSISNKQFSLLVNSVANQKCKLNQTSSSATKVVKLESKDSSQKQHEQPVNHPVASKIQTNCIVMMLCVNNFDTVIELKVVK